MPGRLDETRPFLPVNIALLTVSDTRTAADDRSGNTLAELAETAGHRIAARTIVRDDFAAKRRNVLFGRSVAGFAGDSKFDYL